MLCRGAETSGFLGLLCLTGVPRVKLFSRFTISNRMCQVLEYGGPAEHIAFQPVTHNVKGRNGVGADPYV